MKYYEYKHEEHHHGPGILTAYYEIDHTNEFIRSIEIRPDGGISKYNCDNLDDDFGGLPEVEFDFQLASEFGKLIETKKEIFEKLWK